MSPSGKLILQVKGMHCDGCESRIEKVVSNVRGVTKVEADHSEGQVEIRVTPAVSEEDIKGRISHLGYEVL
jgi:copper chaperone CopZ